MTITYNNYPTLLFLSYDKDNAPEELPFEVASPAVRDYLNTSTGYNELFAYIPVKNSLEGRNTNTNYLLNDDLFTKIDSSEFFRNEQFRNFFTTYVKPKHGTIVFKNGGQYVYLLLSRQDTKSLKKKDGRYMAVALFRNNFFIGFEEAIISERGLEVMPTGRYESGMDLGGYLSFCIITLSYANNKELPLYNNETIKEKIFVL
jgi:hypothetical protein